MAGRRSGYADRLARVPMFRVLGKKDLGMVARSADTVEMKAGTEVVREGSTGHEFFLIASGQATVKRKKRKVATLKAGDHFGELAILADVPRNATVVADTDLELIVIDRRQFAGLLRDVPEIGVKLLRGLALRLSEADARSVH